MYIGALMPPSPIRPMNSPCPIHSGQGGPKVEIARPRAIISAPNSTVQRVPTRSAMRPMMMPPTPEPSHASALASAVIQAAPNAIIMMNSATEATTQDARLSIEEDCNIKEGPGWRSLLQAADHLTTHARVGLLCLLHCAKVRVRAPSGNFLLQRGLT